MKWSTAILSLGFIASNVYAAPTEGLALFKLKVSSDFKELDGHYLSLDSATLGIHKGDDISAIRVFPTSSEKTGYSELHTYPIGIVDHALGLIGYDGLLALKDTVNPAGVKPQEGQVFEWDTFQVVNGKLTNHGEGKWLAFPSARDGWTVNWSDGTGFVTTDYMPVEISLEPAGKVGGHHSG
ncbi:hypothetical protein GGR50DRAFT_690042 [Xylaria sp. CBS 124048]|nr:hypothetical protein GGR50DRAFT_690042 [Xylaria sp. CBS 124048]